MRSNKATGHHNIGGNLAGIDARFALKIYMPGGDDAMISLCNKATPRGVLQILALFLPSHSPEIGAVLLRLRRMVGEDTSVRTVVWDGGEVSDHGSAFVLCTEAIYIGGEGWRWDKWRLGVAGRAI